MALYCWFESSDEWTSLQNELREQGAVVSEVGKVDGVDLLFTGFNYASYDLRAEIKARVRVTGHSGSAQFRIEANMAPNHAWTVTAISGEK